MKGEGMATVSFGGWGGWDGTGLESEARERDGRLCCDDDEGLERERERVQLERIRTPAIKINHGCER